MKEGTLRWNKAFEAIGFKDAIEVRDFPTDDPNFDPDNLKYNCIRYVPIATENAMGPSWADPVRVRSSMPRYLSGVMSRS